MRRVSLAWAGVVVLALASPVPAQGKKQDPKKPAVEAADVLRPGEIAGKVASVSSSTLTLRMEYEHLEPRQRTGNGGRQGGRNANLSRTVLAQQQQLTRLKVQMMAARTPQQRLVTLLQVRQLALQVKATALRQADRGGRNPFRVVKDSVDIEIDLSTGVQVRTSAGKAEMSALAAGQLVQVSLRKNADTESKLQATRILILQEAAQPARPAKKKK